MMYNFIELRSHCQWLLVNSNNYRNPSNHDGLRAEALICLFPDLHTLWEMLHLQLWVRWQPPADDAERRDWERLGNHAGHPAG